MDGWWKAQLALSLSPFYPLCSDLLVIDPVLQTLLYWFGRSLLVKQSRVGVDTAAQLLSFFRQLSETAAAFRRRKVSRHSLFVICVGY